MKQLFHERAVKILLGPFCTAWYSQKEQETKLELLVLWQYIFQLKLRKLTDWFKTNLEKCIADLEKKILIFFSKSWLLLLSRVAWSKKILLNIGIWIPWRTNATLWNSCPGILELACSLDIFPEPNQPGIFFKISKIPNASWV